MQHKKYFAYVRVSTQRQGQLGTSLTEQKSAIDRYAHKFSLTISRYFEERETAAKTGRPVFLEMLKFLQKGKANGVIIHKIDRSARNLRDWADLGNLIDSGVEVHFAAESLDLNSRGGRLSADIQAVVASDYIRNLREETLKGIYGRLNQGLYPFPARVGYLDAGKGQPKKIDPVQAPLVRQAFELYATGKWGLIALVNEMYRRGLRNKQGGKISKNGLSCILHNPLYIGLIKIDKRGEMFIGKHEPIVPKALFDQVKAVFEGKTIPKKEKHFFVFRKKIYCARCRNLFIPERQKGVAYYRCHTDNCVRGAVRENLVDTEVLKFLKPLNLTELEYRYFKKEAQKHFKNSAASFEVNYRNLQLLQDNAAERLSKLADAYMDEVFDKETYLQKNELVLEQQSLKEQLSNLKADSEEAASKLDEFLELVNSAYLSYLWGKPEKKEEVVKSIFSNCEIKDKSVLVKPYYPFQVMAERQPVPAGSPHRDSSRTLSSVAEKLIRYFLNSDTSKNDDEFSKYINSKIELKREKPLPKRNNLFGMTGQ
jgi:site-specific DNA recombinase